MYFLFTKKATSLGISAKLSRIPQCHCVSDWQNYNDQTHSNPRDLRLSSTCGSNRMPSIITALWYRGVSGAVFRAVDLIMCHSPDISLETPKICPSRLGEIGGAIYWLFLCEVESKIVGYQRIVISALWDILDTTYSNEIKLADNRWCYIKDKFDHLLNTVYYNKYFTVKKVELYLD